MEGGATKSSVDALAEKPFDRAGLRTGARVSYVPEVQLSQ